MTEPYGPKPTLKGGTIFSLPLPVTGAPELGVAARD